MCNGHVLNFKNCNDQKKNLTNLSFKLKPITQIELKWSNDHKTSSQFVENDQTHAFWFEIFNGQTGGQNLNFKNHDGQI